MRKFRLELSPVKAGILAGLHRSCIGGTDPN